MWDSHEMEIIFLIYTGKQILYDISFQRTKKTALQLEYKD